MEEGLFILSTKLPLHASCVAIKRRKREIASEILSKYEGSDNLCCALGLNKDRYNRNCETRTNILTRYFQGKHENCSKIFLECCLYGKEHGFTDMKLMRTGMNLARMGDVSKDDLKFISEDEADVFEQLTPVRKDFRETIFFEDFELGVDGKKSFDLPKAFTCTKCISFFQNEQVEIQATLFNYGFNKLRAEMYMYGVKGLCTGTTEGERSERKIVFVEKQSAATVTFPAIPLEIGTFSIKVVAYTNVGGDIVVKPLKVIAEGETVEFDYPVILDPTNQQKRERRDISNAKITGN
ncbi:complement C3 [Trichonephila inaurata madagascariensis]|uniref:Complement C3 n=1 Tax=Trichonephila inaurata madagascariensis TaxID=2747483 RepID=A0A8X7C8Y4_9ARAC|nr:complement C3 [Trichonephila inaurata madagascariensis]